MNQITLLQSFLAFLVMQNLDESIESLSTQNYTVEDDTEDTKENRSLIEIDGKLISPNLQIQHFELFIDSMEKQNHDILSTEYSFTNMGSGIYKFTITFNLKY